MPLTRGAHSHKSHTSEIETRFLSIVLCTHFTHDSRSLSLSVFLERTRRLFTSPGARTSGPDKSCGFFSTDRTDTEKENYLARKTKRLGDSGETRAGYFARRFFRCLSPSCDVSVAKDAPPFSYRHRPGLLPSDEHAEKPARDTEGIYVFSLVDLTKRLSLIIVRQHDSISRTRRLAAHHRSLVVGTIPVISATIPTRLSRISLTTLHADR